MRQRRLRYILYTLVFILGVSVMTYLLLWDDFPHKVPLRAREVFQSTSTRQDYVADRHIFNRETRWA